MQFVHVGAETRIGADRGGIVQPKAFPASGESEKAVQIVQIVQFRAKARGVQSVQFDLRRPHLVGDVKDPRPV